MITYAPFSILQRLPGHPSGCEKLTTGGALMYALAGLAPSCWFTVTELFEVTKPFTGQCLKTVRRHLRRVERLGLVVRRRFGKQIKYRRKWGKGERKFEFVALEGLPPKQQLSSIIAQMPTAGLRAGGRRLACIAKFAGTSVWSARLALRRLVGSKLLNFTLVAGNRYYRPVDPEVQAEYSGVPAPEAVKAPKKTKVKKVMDFLTAALATAKLPTHPTNADRKRCLSAYKAWLDSGEPIDSLGREQQLDILCGRWVLFTAKAGGASGRITKYERASIASVLDWVVAIEDDGFDPRLEMLAKLAGKAPVGMMMDAIAALFTQAFSGFTYRTHVIFQPGVGENFDDYALQALIDVSKARFCRKDKTAPKTLKDVFKLVHPGKGITAARPTRGKHDRMTGDEIRARIAVLEARKRT